MLAQRERIVEQCPLGLLGVVTPEVEPVRHLEKLSVQAERGDDRDVRHGDSCPEAAFPEGSRTDHGVDVVASAPEEDAPKALGSRRRIRGKRVRRRGEDRVCFVDVGRPGVGEHSFGLLVERLDAALEKFSGVEVVVGRPLEELPSGCFDDEVVVRRRADVAGLAVVANPRVLLSYSRQISEVSSVDALSEMISSKSPKLCPSSESRDLAR